MRSKEVHLLERPQGMPTLGQFGIDVYFENERV